MKLTNLISNDDRNPSIYLCPTSVFLKSCFSKDERKKFKNKSEFNFTTRILNNKEHNNENRANKANHNMKF